MSASRIWQVALAEARSQLADEATGRERAEGDLRRAQQARPMAPLHSSLHTLLPAPLLFPQALATPERDRKAAGARLGTAEARLAATSDELSKHHSGKYSCHSRT